MLEILKELDLNDTAVFDPDSGSSDAYPELIEVDVTPADTLTSRRRTVTEDLIQAYIEHDFPAPATPTKESLKLFFSTRHGTYNGNMLPIPMSADTFQRIAPYARIPKVYLDIIHRKTPVHIYCTPEIPLITRNNSVKLALREYLSFVIQSVPGAMNGVCMGASFTYHFTTRTMYIFMHGISHPNYHRFSRLLENGAAKITPFIIPSLLIQCHLEDILGSMNNWHDNIYSYETQLGIRIDVHDSTDRTFLDFPRLSKNVNAAITNLGYVSLSCNATARWLDFMDDVMNKYGALAKENNMTEDEVEEVQLSLRQRHEYLRSWNKGLEERAEYLSKRGQALVQTVYSGIAQRDSASSIKLAAISTRLAESSQDIAVLTSRDSAVMRLIAAITIFFLPATFVATFFSTSFFDFSVGRNERVYSWWLWLYFVVTVVLTVIVLVGTWIMWKNKENELAAHFKRPQQKVSAEVDVHEKA